MRGSGIRGRGSPGTMRARFPDGRRARLLPELGGTAPGEAREAGR